MRKIVCLAGILALVAIGVGRGDQPKEIKALLDKAIKASGGEARLAKIKGETFKIKGKFYAMGEGMDYTGSFAVLPPDKARMEINGSVGDNKFSFIRVINGDKAWIKVQENIEEANKEQLAETREEMNAEKVASLLPLKGPEYQLKLLGEVQVAGKPALGICVSRKGYRDVKLYFDKDTSLLVKSETTVKDPMAGDKEIKQESINSDFKEIQGVQRAMKVAIYRDGQKFIDGKVIEFQFKDKLDDALFDKPE